jgi:glutamate-1-semialdehyde aminotransferase
MGLGAVILGYGHHAQTPQTPLYVSNDYQPLFTLPSTIEIEVAEQVVAMVPGVEAVRFGKSGSDAVAAAVRAARIHTGRDLIVFHGYHGWHDWWAASSERNAGIPAVMRELAVPLKTFLLQPEWDRVAALVIEPDTWPADDLPRLCETVRQNDGLVIFDEVITGFRAAVGGWREVGDVTPDLSAFGKCLANGMPLSCVAGPWSVMSAFEHGFWSTTHAHERVSMAAALATLRALEDGKVLMSINRKGDHLIKSLTDLGYRLHGYGARIVLDFDSDEHKTAVLEVLADRRILCNGNIFLSAAHTDADCERVLDGFARARDARVPRGRVIAPIYRKA